MKKVLVWDLPLRAFHWLLVASVAGAIVTAKIGGNLMDWHGRLGMLILGLLLFRLVWGFIGSTHSRFLNFLPSPGRIRAYLAGTWRGLGHNPLGALSVFALLALIAIQCATGLFANDDIAFQGPLYPLVSEGLSGRLTGIHHLAGNALLAFIGLHVAAVVFYSRVKKTNLVLPMVTGMKEVAADEAEPARGGGIAAFVLAAALAGATLWYIGSGRLVERFAPPPPPPATSTPTW